MNRHPVGGRGGLVVERIAEDIEQPPKCGGTNRHANRSARALNEHSASQPFRVAEYDCPHTGLAKVVGYFKQNFPTVGTEPESLVDGGHGHLRELGLDDRSANRSEAAERTKSWHRRFDSVCRRSLHLTSQTDSSSAAPRSECRRSHSLMASVRLAVQSPNSAKCPLGIITWGRSRPHPSVSFRLYEVLTLQTSSFLAVAPLSPSSLLPLRSVPIGTVQRLANHWSRNPTDISDFAGPAFDLVCTLVRDCRNGTGQCRRITNRTRHLDTLLVIGFRQRSATRSRADSISTRLIATSSLRRVVISSRRTNNRTHRSDGQTHTASLNAHDGNLVLAAKHRAFVSSPGPQRHGSGSVSRLSFPPFSVLYDAVLSTNSRLTADSFRFPPPGAIEPIHASEPHAPVPHPHSRGANRRRRN